MKKLSNKLIVGGFVGYIGLFMIGLIITEKEGFSELENRMLQQMPALTKESFFEGEFGEDFETFIADQFPARNSFIAIKSYAELFQGKTENNGVYIGENGQLLQKFEEPDKGRMIKNAGYINALAENMDVTLMLAPTATKVYEELLPKYATPYDEERYIEEFISELSEKVKTVDVLEKLQQHKDEYIYFKTDHHWTMNGAYYAYVAYCEREGITPRSLKEFESKKIEEGFYGSLFSKGNFMYIKPDEFKMMVAKNDPVESVEYVNNGEIKASLYEEKYLESKDKYSVFLDGNHPLIKIKTSVENGEKLLIVKDSYANSLIPFLVHHYDEIHVLDLRFLNMKVQQYVEAEGINKALILYNVQNFSAETKFSLLK